MTLAICGAVTSLALAAIARTKATRAISIMAIPIVLGLLVVAEFALLTLVGRFGADPLGDYRFRIASTTIEAAQTFQPVGSGIGTFVPVYQIYERNADLIVTYVNHAHDDWLELWLEGGWPILAVIACGLAWLVRATVRAWRTPDTGESYATIDRALPRAASIGLVLLLAHSVVDYPLRTTALSVVFAILAALLTPAPRRQQPLGTIPGAP
jgi:O-antigen ligase